MKRVSLVIGFIIIVIGIGTTIYFAFFRIPPTPTKPGTVVTPQPSGGLPQAGVRVPGTEIAPEITGLPQASPVARGGITSIKSLRTGTIQGTTATPDGKSIQYYDGASGKFFTIEATGTAKELSAKTFFNVDKITWAPGKNKAVLEYPDGAKLIYDFKNDKQITIPKHWEQFSFSPTGNQLTGLSIGVDPNNRWLFTANADGTASRIIEPLGNNADKVQVAWSPNDQVIAFSDTGEAEGFGRAQILLIGKNRENFPGLTVEGLNFEGKWSPSGSHILYSAASPDANMRPVLWIVNGTGDAIGTGRRSLELNTWTDKCTFADETTLYCAVPTNLASGSGLQRDSARFLPDNFYKLNLASGSKALLAVPETTVNATNLSISADNTTLFFQDAIHGGLYSMRLK